jgi:hypothetical protein
MQWIISKKLTLYSKFSSLKFPDQTWNIVIIDKICTLYKHYDKTMISNVCNKSLILVFLQTFSGRKKPQWKWENSSAELKKKEQIQIWNISWSKKSTDPKCRPILKVSWSWKLANRRNQLIRGTADYKLSKDACNVLHLRTGLREPEYRNTHSQLPKEMGPGAGTYFFLPFYF